MSDPEKLLREKLKRAVTIARRAGLDDETISLAVAGTLVSVKAEGYKP